MTGCTVGSKSFTFRSKLSPLEIRDRNIQVKADSPASLLLVFQAILPFLLFAGDRSGSPITVTIQGGTNVNWSLSYEYLDQVLLPALERFGVIVERKLECRGWVHGPQEVGSAKFKFTPLSPGQLLKEPAWPTERGAIAHIDVSLLVPSDILQVMRKSLSFELELVFPDITVNFVLVEASKHKTRIYVLLVAHTSTGLRFGRDCLYNGKTKDKNPDELSTEVSQTVVDELDAELRKGGLVDEYLQDQLVIFQALAGGKSNIPGSLETLTSVRDRVECTDEPFGDGSMHTTTARWVASQLLPQVKWIDRGRICEGAGWSVSPIEEALANLHVG